MIPCPICSTPMQALTRGLPRQFCSQRCSGIGCSRLWQLWNLDVDDVTVDRLIHGERTTATKAERHEAIGTLTALGYSLIAIADRLHITARTVSRHRADLKAAS